MTITTVHECSSSAYAASVLFGEPMAFACTEQGRTLRFPPGRIVAYRMRVRRYATGCVFRTAVQLGAGEAVPGVSPAPVLLWGFARGRHFDNLLGLVRELGRRGIADALSDAAYLGVAPALARPHAELGLLADVMEASWTC